jgi:molybdenum cofactor cytidylyltransferase
MDLARALRIEAGDSLAFSGAGGKTTALFQLARQLEPPVVVTTTTHLASDQLALADRIIRADQSANISHLMKKLENEIIVLVGEEAREGRVKGLSEGQLNELAEITKRHGITLLIEADGSRQRPIKAPGAHEPVIPLFVNHVVVIAGLSAIGKPLSQDWVHRPELYVKLSGLDMGQEISPNVITRVLIDSDGGLKGIPPGARRICMLNQADNDKLQSQANRIARLLIPHYEAVVVGSLKHNLYSMPDEAGLSDEEEVSAVYEPIAGIVLAAGGSDRMGRVKQLLPWRNEPLVRHVTKSAISSGLMPVVVVVGDARDEVREALADLQVILVDNPEWQSGQSSSLRVGLKALPPGTGAAIFLLADMPLVPEPLIQKIAERHAGTLSPIIAPQFDGQRGNPVLFDQKTFSDLKNIEGDAGGRGIFSKYQVDWVEWHDSTVLLDVDTEEDYQRLLLVDT